MAKKKTARIMWSPTVGLVKKGDIVTIWRGRKVKTFHVGKITTSKPSK